MAIRVFICYARQDKKHRKKLDNHLAFLRRTNLIEQWHDGQINPGEQWEPKLLAELHRAHALVVLVTASLAGSLYCVDVELEHARERRRRGTLTVIPILVSETGTFQDHWLSTIQRVPAAGPVTSYRRRDAAWAHVADAIRGQLLAMPESRRGDRRPRAVNRLDVRQKRVAIPQLRALATLGWTEVDGEFTAKNAWRVRLRSPFGLRVHLGPAIWAREDSRLQGWERIDDLPAQQPVGTMRGVHRGQHLLTVVDPISSEPRAIQASIGGRVVALPSDGELVEPYRPLVEIELPPHTPLGECQFVEDWLGTQIGGLFRFHPPLKHPSWPRSISTGDHVPILDSRPRWTGRTQPNITIRALAGQADWHTVLRAPVPGKIGKTLVAGARLITRTSSIQIDVEQKCCSINWNVQGVVKEVYAQVGQQIAYGAPIALVDLDEIHIESTTSGTFYRAEAPDAQPFVEVGDRVRPGQTLCIVEAMKLLNELDSEADGVVREVLVENGHPVQFGQPIFTLSRQ